MAQDGSVPAFSNRDAAFVDLAAPGVGVLSTFPRALTASHPSCADQGYSDCGTPDYRQGDGTSFAAPQVTAAAALLLAERPDLTSDQVAAILGHSADDVTPATGCARCAVGRDALSGRGSLDVAAALQALSRSLPYADRLEPNDDGGALSAKVWGSSSSIKATVDYWDDPVDVYAVRVKAGERLSVRLHGPGIRGLALAIWKPGTQHVTGAPQAVASQRLFQSLRAGPSQSVQLRAKVSGWYRIEVKVVAPGAGPYLLQTAKTR
jgi:hypothetical protein